MSSSHYAHPPPHPPFSAATGAPPTLTHSSLAAHDRAYPGPVAAAGLHRRSRSELSEKIHECSCRNVSGAFWLMLLFTLGLLGAGVGVLLKGLNEQGDCHQQYDAPQAGQREYDDCRSRAFRWIIASIVLGGLFLLAVCCSCFAFMDMLCFRACMPRHIRRRRASYSASGRPLSPRYAPDSAGAGALYHPNYEHLSMSMAEAQRREVGIEMQAIASPRRAAAVASTATAASAAASAQPQVQLHPPAAAAAATKTHPYALRPSPHARTHSPQVRASAAGVTQAASAALLAPLSSHHARVDSIPPPPPPPSSAPDAAPNALRPGLGAPTLGAVLTPNHAPVPAATAGLAQPSVQQQQTQLLYSADTAAAPAIARASLPLPSAPAAAPSPPSRAMLNPPPGGLAPQPVSISSHTSAHAVPPVSNSTSSAAAVPAPPRRPSRSAVQGAVHQQQMQPTPTVAPASRRNSLTPTLADIMNRPSQ